MTNNNNPRYSGTVHFWNGVFGFIVSKLGFSCFFHITEIISEDKSKISLMCEVEFSISTITQGKHKGKQNAIEIKWLADCNLINYPERMVGILEEWKEFVKPQILIGPNRRTQQVKYFKGLIKSPQQVPRVQLNSSQKTI
jgi:cold shock CspA family protein